MGGQSFKGQELTGDDSDGFIINGGPPLVVLAECILAALHPAAPEVYAGGGRVVIQIDLGLPPECPSRSTPVGTGGAAFQIVAVDAHVQMSAG